MTVHSNVLLLPAPQSAGFPCLRHLVVSHLAGVSAQAAVKLLALPSAQRLTVLELSHTSLAAPPAGLTALTALRTLVLASSKLKSLSNSQLHLLPQLQHLDLCVPGLAWPDLIASDLAAAKRTRMHMNARTHVWQAGRLPWDAQLTALSPITCTVAAAAALTIALLSCLPALAAWARCAR